MDMDELNAERVKALLDALPAVIRVGAFDIAIMKFARNSHDRARNFGQFSAIEQKIHIDPDMASPFRLVDTFIHEVLHAIWWASTLPAKSDEESTVQSFAAALVDLHRNNRWLAPWLTMGTAPVEPPRALSFEDMVRGLAQGYSEGTEKPPHCHGLDC